MVCRVHKLDSLLGVELPAANGQAAAVMVGAGFSRALNPKSPLWHDLVYGVRQKIFPEEPEPSGKASDVVVEVFRLSWRSSRLRDARSTPFQLEVNKLLEESWPNSTSDPTFGGRAEPLSTAFAAFLRLVGCQIILDLNYDPAVERMLDAANIRYVRWIGSEAEWAGPIPGDALVLWKLHGSLSHPATIVLSPTEYQRLYEVNAIGSALTALGRRIRYVWSVGVGLQDDDVWAYLCASSDFTVIPLWLTQPATDPDTALKSWKDAVGADHREVTVIHGELNDGKDELAQAIAKIVSTIEARLIRQTPHSPGRDAEDRARRFDQKFQDAVENGLDTWDLIAQYHATYTAFRDDFLCRRQDGYGPRWCPSVTLANSEQLHVSATRTSIAKDLVAVIAAANDAIGESFKQDGRPPILISAAAQAAVKHVIDLAEMLGLEVSTSVNMVGAAREISAHQPMLVGTNPFTMRQDGHSNPMHIFTPDKAIYVGPPLILSNDFTLAGAKPGLLTEDEWEAAVIFLYRRADSALNIEKVDADLSNIPPLYPWGFRISDVREFRKYTGGTISKCWHLVNTFLTDRRQVCKGGGLRDCHPRTFEIGSRGALRIGEYDEFLSEAFRFTNA